MKAYVRVDPQDQTVELAEVAQPTPGADDGAVAAGTTHPHDPWGGPMGLTDGVTEPGSINETIVPGRSLIAPTINGWTDQRMDSRHVQVPWPGSPGGRPSRRLALVA